MAGVLFKQGMLRVHHEYQRGDHFTIGKLEIAPGRQITAGDHFAFPQQFQLFAQLGFRQAKRQAGGMATLF
ncbi:hypothetical protein D3C80_1690020 [compost metagenome]